MNFFLIRVHGGDLNLQFLFNFTSQTASAGFNTEFLVGVAPAVPEPRAIPLVIFAAGFVLRRRRPNRQARIAEIATGR